MDKKHLINVGFLKKKTIKSIALATILFSLVLVVYQLFLVKMIEEYNKKTALMHDSLKVNSLLNPSHSEKGQYICLPSGMTISLSKLNDDYCDCPDGSDEPKTEACSLGAFTCKNGKVKIPSSRVNDGICDCCDGSDEWKNITSLIVQSIDIQKKTNVFHPICPNTCSI